MSGYTQEQLKNARKLGIYDEIWQDTGKCVFCDLKDKYIVMEENGVVLTVSLFPYIDGNLMAIPRRHVSSPKQLSRGEWEAMRKFNYIAKKLIRKAHGIKSMWTLIREGGAEAQMTVGDHLHTHFIPIDSKDICEWNYREIKNTPVENALIYRKLASKINKMNQNFSEKYMTNDLLPVVVDVLIINQKNRVLLQERTPEMKLIPDTYTLPGGHIDADTQDLKLEAMREVEEETGLKLLPQKLELLDSRISHATISSKSVHLDLNIPRSRRFLWNTYIYRGLSDKARLTPGDDCFKLHWVDLGKISEANVSDELKQLLAGVA